MRFIGASNFDHGTKPKIGVLLTNLGTPEAPTAKALRPYLKQFLWDPPCRRSTPPAVVDDSACLHFDDSSKEVSRSLL